MLYVFCVVLCVSFCSGPFVMVPLNLTYLHCVQHYLFEHLFNLYYRESSTGASPVLQDCLPLFSIDIVLEIAIKILPQVYHMVIFFFKVSFLSSTFYAHVSFEGISTHVLILSFF